MAEHNYKFNVTMTCGGCSGAIERVLKKMEGTNAFSDGDHTEATLMDCRRCQRL